MSTLYNIIIGIGLVWLFSSPFYQCSTHSAVQKSSLEIAKSVKFTKHIIHDEFISEGVAIGDVNRDGLKDILAGCYWFEAPTWTRHEMQKPQYFDYTKGYSNSFQNFAMDVNQDGWVDFIRIHFPGKGVYWHENPKGQEEHWKEHLIDSSACNESPMFVDVDNNGRMDLVFGHERSGSMMWLRSPDLKGSTEWEAIPISKEKSLATARFSHGLGFGDVDGDGRNDIITRHGWWEAPLDAKKVPWPFHQADLGEPCSQMYAYDFNSDGHQDIISASAHAYGIWWHEFTPGKNGVNIERHLIDSTYSQTHGLAFTDLNSDGKPDFITGKRFFAHQGKDPGGLEPPLLKWYELKHDQKGNPQWVSHLIDDDSGVGVQVVVEDLNGDNKLDIINANKKGVIYFLQK